MELVSVSACQLFLAFQQLQFRPIEVMAFGAMCLGNRNMQNPVFALAKTTSARSLTVGGRLRSCEFERSRSIANSPGDRAQPNRFQPRSRMVHPVLPKRRPSKSMSRVAYAASAASGTIRRPFTSDSSPGASPNAARSFPVTGNAPHAE